MKKLLMLFSLIVIVLISLNATTQKITKGCQSQAYWYLFFGSQNTADRKDPSKYGSPTTIQPNCGIGTGWECAVQLQNQGTPPPAHPNFNNITFDIEGFPNGNKSGQSDFVANLQKLSH